MLATVKNLTSESWEGSSKSDHFVIRRKTKQWAVYWIHAPLAPELLFECQSMTLIPILTCTVAPSHHLQGNKLPPSYFYKKWHPSTIKWGDKHSNHAREQSSTKHWPDNQHWWMQHFQVMYRCIYIVPNSNCYRHVYVIFQSLYAANLNKPDTHV